MSKQRKETNLTVFSMQIVAPDEKRTGILRTLASLLRPSRAAAGCMQARLYADLDKRKTLLLVEEWESREQFEHNLDTAKINAIVAAIELSERSAGGSRRRRRTGGRGGYPGPSSDDQRECPPLTQCLKPDAKMHSRERMKAMRKILISVAMGAAMLTAGSGARLRWISAPMPTPRDFSISRR